MKRSFQWLGLGIFCMLAGMGMIFTLPQTQVSAGSNPELHLTMTPSPLADLPIGITTTPFSPRDIAPFYSPMMSWSDVSLTFTLPSEIDVAFTLGANSDMAVQIPPGGARVDFLRDEISLGHMLITRTSQLNTQETTFADLRATITALTPLLSSQTSFASLITYPSQNDPEDHAVYLIGQGRYFSFNAGQEGQFARFLYLTDEIEWHVGYEGLTVQGEFYISASFAVDIAPLTPDALIVDIESYARQLRVAMDALPETAFTPTLTELDAMMESIYLGSTLFSAQ